MQFYKNDPILILRADLVNMPIGARLFLLVGAVATLHHAEEEERSWRSWEPVLETRRLERAFCTPNIGGFHLKINN